MRIQISKLSSQGDTLMATVEGDKVRPAIEELLRMPRHFVAIENNIVHTIDEAMLHLEGLEEGHVLDGQQVAGG